MQCFVVWSDEIEGRLDPNLYEPKYKKLLTDLKKIKCQALGDIIAFSNETWDQKTFFGDKFPYIEISEIDVISGEIRNIIYYNKKEAPSRARMVVREDDIIVSTTRPHRGAISLIDKSRDGFIASTGFAVLRELKTNEINRDFLFYTLKSDFCLTQMLQRSSGGNYPAITTEELKKIIIPLPPLSVQNQIVDIMQSAFVQKKQKEAEAQGLLDSIDDYVLDELVIKLPEVKDKQCFTVNSEEVQSNRADAYYYQPKFEKVEKAIKSGQFEVENGKDLFVLIESGKGVSPEQFTHEGIGFLEVKNIGLIGISLPEFYVQEDNEMKYVQKGDIVTGRVGSIGSFALYDIEDNFAFSDNVLRIKCIASISNLYLTAILNSILVKIQIDRSKKGSLQNVINRMTLNDLRIPRPPLDIQNKIAEEVKRRISEAERLKAEATKIIEEAKKQVEKMILGD